MNENSPEMRNTSKIKLDEAVSFLLTQLENFVKFKIDVCENLTGFSSAQLEKLTSHFKEKAAVILFAATGQREFMLFWKSNKIQTFLTLKSFNYQCTANNSYVWEFIVDLVINLLNYGYLGVRVSLNSQKAITEVELGDLADFRGYNLLLIACESGNDEFVPILLKCGLPWKLSSNNQITAQILAQQGKHSNVLLKLLQANLPFPATLDVKDCSKELKDFIEMSTKFHEFIKTNNKEKLEEIITQNPNLRHFYNLSNKSAIYTALDKNLIDLYEFLVSKNISFGPDEKVGDVFRYLRTSDKDRVHKINLKYTKSFPSKHVNIIMANTTLTHDETDGDGKRQIVLRAYRILNEHPILEVILRAVAASKDFHIVFDFFKDSTYRFDPWTSESTKGIFYFNGQITIGAKELLNSETENQVLGTLAHELCHFAVFAAFQNNAKPHRANDRQAEEDLAEIIKICKTKMDLEKYIRLVYDNYRPSQHPAELIVRPAHLIALYRLEPETLKQKREIFIELFRHVENVVIPAIEAAIPDIEARLVYKSTQAFGKLSEQNQTKVKKAIVLYQNEKVKLCELYPENNDIYDKLTPDHITQLLDGKVLNFDDPHLRYLEELIDFKWESLAKNLTKKVLGSNAIYEGKIVKLDDLNSKYPKALKFLTSIDIKNILKGTEISILEKLEKDAKFYAKRSFINEDAKMICFEYEYGHDYVHDICRGDEEEHVKNRTENKTFQDLCDEFLKFNFDEQAQIFEKVRENSAFKIQICDLNHKDFQFMHKDSVQFIQQAQKERILILSSEAGAGKTATFENLAIEIKNKNPTQSVSYIDLKNHTKFYEKSGTAENVEELLEKILNLSSKSEFERKVFEESFKSGNVVLLWNGFDEISPTYNGFILNLIKNIYENTKNVQFVCTRPLYSDQLSKAFKTRSWQLVPFDENAKRDFLRQFFVSQNVRDEKIEVKIQKVKEIIEKFQFEKIPDFVYNFSTPLMLKIIAEIYDDKNLIESGNLYEIFDKFVSNKIQIWLDRSENSPEKVNNVRNFGILEKIYQKFALLRNLHLFSSTLRLKLRKLQIMQTEIPENLPHEEISRMGILYINGKNNFEFAHKTFSDFFVAQFFIENIYNAANNVDNDEAELRLELFFSLTKKYGSNQKIITDFMSSYIDSQSKNKVKKFNFKISQLLIGKFKNFCFRMLDIDHPDVFSFLFKFFQRDHELLVDLLHINEDETLYTAIFNPNYFGLFINPEEIKNLARTCLTDDELQKFLSGKNQNGKILFGTHFYRLLDVPKVHEFYHEQIESLKVASFWEFFDKINEFLTLDERKELFVTAASPKIYLFYDKMFDTSDLSEYEKLWSKFEHLLTQSEMQELLGNFFIQYYEIYPGNKKGHDNFLSLFLEMSEKFLSSSQIYEMFLTKNILHEAHWHFFEILWNFLKNHTNAEERKKILLQDDIDDKNFYFYSQDYEKKKSFSSYVYPHFHYDFTPFKIFHRSMTISNASNFKFTKEIHRENFSKSEIQKIILGSNDFIYYAIGMTDEEPFGEFVSYLEELFGGNERSLMEFLERKVAPTNLSVFDFVEDFRGLPFPTWFNNLKSLTDSYEKSKNHTLKLSNLNC